MGTVGRLHERRTPHCFHNIQTFSALPLITDKLRVSQSKENIGKGRLREGRKGCIRVGSKYFGAMVTTTVGMDQWYKREETNPWRPIASQIMNELVEPPWCRNEISRPLVKKANPFHFSRLRRQADIEISRRRKKREWMIKAHLIAKGDPSPISGVDYLRPENKNSTSVHGPDITAHTQQFGNKRGDRYEFEMKRHSHKPTNEFGYSGHRNQSLPVKAPHRAEGKEMETERDYRDRYDYKAEIQRSRDTTDQHPNWNFIDIETDPDFDMMRPLGDTDIYRKSKAEEEEEEYNYYHNPSRIASASPSAHRQSLDLLSDDADLLKWRLVT